MDFRVLRRPVKALLCAKPQCLFSINSTTSRRHESSYRRTKQRLNIKPDASFLPSDTQLQDHVIFNPPSSAPSVTHTPLMFLPKDDKRRHLLAATASRLTSGYKHLPPPGDRKKHPKHHLKEEDIAEIKRLRLSDPELWSRNKLAKKFDCSPVFVGHIVQAPAEKRAIARAQIDAVKAKWGPRRRMAREDREKRIQMAKRDE